MGCLATIGRGGGFGPSAGRARLAEPEPMGRRRNFGILVSGVRQAFVELLCLSGNRVPAEFFDRAFPASLSKLLSQFRISHQFIDFAREVARELVRIKRLKRTCLRLLQGHEKARFAVDDYLCDAADRARHYRSLTSHGFQIDNTKRLIS